MEHDGRCVNLAYACELSHTHKLTIAIDYRSTEDLISNHDDFRGEYCTENGATDEYAARDN
jgi:hypothetical protein